MVFETTASAIPPLRHGNRIIIRQSALPVKSLSTAMWRLEFDAGDFWLYNNRMVPSFADNKRTPSRKPHAFWRRPRKALLITALLFSIGAVYWYNEHRTIPWSSVFSPSYWLSRYQGDDMFEAENALLWHGNRQIPEVAITFDDGPHIDSRAGILDTLKALGVHATFFDVGMRMEQNPGLVLRTLAEGNEEANHSFTHRRLDEVTPQDRHREINDPDIAFFRITGRHLALLRPPGMRYNTAVLRDTHEAGYIVVGYNAASGDFDKQEAPEYIAKRTIERTENGAIILLHDYSGTAAALRAIITTLRSRGFRFVTISQMIEHLPARPREAAHAFQRIQELHAENSISIKTRTTGTSR